VAAVPDAPTDLVLDSADISQVTFTWTAPFHGGSPITEYKVYWDEGDSEVVDFVLSDELSSYGTTASIYTRTVGVEAASLYRFKVTAVNEIGESD
jgi:hypothetical protein